MTDERMQVAVLVREVRDPRPPVRLADGGMAVRDTGVRRVVNPADLSAVEIAARLAEGAGAEVTAVAVGNDRLDDALRLALSMGATRAVRVWDQAIKDGDAVAEAKVLRRVLDVLRPALFFTGTGLLDRGDEPSAALAAATASLPFTTCALSFELAGGGAEVVRRSERGGRERVALRLPAAVFFDALAAEPRYPDLPAVLAALDREVERWGIEELGLPVWELGFAGAVLRPGGVGAPRHDPLRVPTPDPTLPAHERVRALFSGGIRPRAGKIHFGSAEDAADRILAVFAEEGLLPGAPRRS